jgi:uncharacterized protein (TIGR03067 family)
MARGCDQGIGKDVPTEEFKTIYLTFKGDHIAAMYGKKTAEATYKLIQTEAGPSQIDLAVTQGPEKAPSSCSGGCVKRAGAMKP